MTFRMAAIVSFLLIAVPVKAHELMKGPNGGRLVEASPHHIELVVSDRMVTVYVTGAEDKPVAVTGFKGLAILTVSGKALRIALEAKGDNRLSGSSPVALPAGVRGVVQVTGPDGKTVQGRFQ